MVTKWGLSEKLGPLLYEAEDTDPFNGMPGQSAKGFSDITVQTIDSEVKEIIDFCYSQANKILQDNRDILDAMAGALMKYETIDSGQLDQLLAREQVTPPEDWDEGDGQGMDSSQQTDAENSPITVNKLSECDASDVP
jgi:cell division protease FtsH